MADLAELGIIYVEQGYEAAVQHMSNYKDVAAEVVQSEDDRVKAAGKVIQSQAALSDQIAKTTVAFNSSKSAQYEFQAAALGVTNQLEKQIAFLRSLEEQAAFAAEAQKASIRWAREEEAALLDLARDIQHLNKVRAQEAAEAEAARKRELASRDAYYAKIIADAKAAEQAIIDAKHKAILQQQEATAKATALYIKEENERVKAAEKAAAETAKIQKKAAEDANKAAEQAAIAEIQWSKKSRDEQIRIKEEIATYKKAGVSNSTLGSMYGQGALTGNINEVHNLAEKWNNVSLNTSRARSEMVVLAHEAVQGRFSRIPASLMVFAEYTDITALAMSGLGLAVMGTVAAIVGLSIAVVKGTLEQRELQNALISTGNYAGATAGQLDEMAHSSTKMGGSLSLAKSVILDLAQSGKFTATQINEVTGAVVKMEYATGGGEESIKKLVEGFKSLQVEANSHSRYSDQITQAVLKLDAQYHFLTSSVLEHIRALEEEGRAKEASALATEEFAKATKSRAEEMVGNLGTIEKGWRSIKEAIGEAWSAMKDLGKSDTIQSRLQDAKDKLEKLKDPTISIGYQTINFGTEHRRKLQIEQQEIVNQLSKELLNTQERALEQGERAARQSEANVAYGSLQLKLVQMKADKEGELAKFTREQNSNLEKMVSSPTATPEFIAKVTKETKDVIAAFAEKINRGQKVADSYNQIAASIEAANQKALESIKTEEKVSATEQLRITTMKQINLAYKEGTLTLEKKAKAIALLDVALANTTLATERVQGLKDEVAALEMVDKAQAEAQKSYDKMIDSALNASKKVLDSLDQQIAKQIQHNSEIGKTKEQIELERSVHQDASTKALEAEATRLTALLDINEEMKRQGELVDKLTPQQEEMSRMTLNGLDQEIIRRKQLKELLLEGAVLEANAAAAKKALADWKKGWESVDKLGQDTFMAWAEKGKSAAQVIGDALKQALLQAIYQAMAKPMLAQIYVSATSGLGVPSIGGGQGGSIGDLLNTARSGNSLYNNISGLFGGSSGASSAFSFAGLPGAGIAAHGVTSTFLPTTALGIESGMTSFGGSIYGIGAPAVAGGVTLPGFAAGVGGDFAAGAAGAALPVVGAEAATVGGLGGAGAAAGIPGIGWAIGGALLLAGLLGGGSGRYVQSTGETSMWFDAQGKEREKAKYRFDYANNEGADAFATAMNKSYIDTAKALGITTSSSHFAYGGNDADSSTGQGKFRIGAGVEGRSGKYFNSGEIAASDEAIKLATSRALLTVLSDSALPKYLSGFLDKIGDASTMSQKEIDAVMKTAQAFANLSKTLDTLPFTNLKDQTYEVYKALVDAAGGMEEFGKKLASYYDNYYTEEEKRAQTLKNISKRLSEGGMDLGVEALEKMSRADFRALFETIQNTFSTQASTNMIAALLDVQAAFAGITTAAEAANKSLAKTKKELLDIATNAASDALTSLQNSVDAQKLSITNAYDLQVTNLNLQLTSITTSVGKLQSFAGSLKSTLDSMHIIGSDSSSRTAAQAQISSALAIARAGGALPLDGQLSGALQTVSRPSEQLFATFTDYARDFYRTANDIASLSDITGTQLTAQEQLQKSLQDQLEADKIANAAQLKALDDIAANAKKQLDAANGINTTLKTLVTAMTDFNAAVAGLVATRTGQGLPSTTVTGATSTSAGSGFVTVGGGAPTAPSDAQTAKYRKETYLGAGYGSAYMNVTDASEIARLDSINQYINTLDFSEAGKADAVRAVYAKAKEFNVSQSDIATATGYGVTDIRKMFEAQGIPAFATGGSHAGGLRFVGETGVELEATGPSRIWNADQTRSMLSGAQNNSELVAELQEVKALLAEILGGTVDIADSSKRSAKILTNVTHGGEAMQTQVFA